MTEEQLAVLGIFILIIGVFLDYSAPKIYERYCDYKEQEMKESFRFQTDVESLKYEQSKEDIKLKIEEERTKQEQIKLAQEIARKEKEEEDTKQLQIKAEFRKETGSSLY